MREANSIIAEMATTEDSAMSMDGDRTRRDLLPGVALPPCCTPTTSRRRRIRAQLLPLLRGRRPVIAGDRSRLEHGLCARCRRGTSSFRFGEPGNRAGRGVPASQPDHHVASKRPPRNGVRSARPRIRNTGVVGGERGTTTSPGARIPAAGLVAAQSGGPGDTASSTGGAEPTGDSSKPSDPGETGHGSVGHSPLAIIPHRVLRSSRRIVYRSPVRTRHCPATVMPSR